MPERSVVRRVPSATGGSYSDAVVVSGSGSTIYISGQLPLVAGKLIDADDVATQAECCFDNLAAVLERSGSSLRDVIRLVAYLTRFDEYSAYTAVRERRFAEGLPASTAVGVDVLLGGALIEIDAVACTTEAAGDCGG